MSKNMMNEKKLSNGRSKAFGTKLVVGTLLLVLGVWGLASVAGGFLGSSSATAGSAAPSMPTGVARLIGSSTTAGVARPNPPAVSPSIPHLNKHGKPAKFKGDPYPTGVTDYGVNGASTYSYYAESVWSHVDFSRLYLTGCAQTSTTGCTLGYQENAITQNVWECTSGGACANGQYWTQDVINIAQTAATTFTVSVGDNIWNFTAGNSCSYGSMSEAPISGSGGISTYSCGSYYSYGYSTTYSLSLPFQIWIWMNGYVNSNDNAVVQFYWDVCDNAGCSGVINYDTVTFNSLGGACGSCAGDDQYLISGTTSTGVGLPFDLEGDLTGNCCGHTVTVPAATFNMYDSYASTPVTSAGSTFYVPHAYSTGDDTAETVSNVMMAPQFPNNVLGETGPDNSIQLY